jgi:hypothetical protein
LIEQARRDFEEARIIQRALGSGDMYHPARLAAVQRAGKLQMLIWSKVCFDDPDLERIHGSRC